MKVSAPTILAALAIVALSLTTLAWLYPESVIQAGGHWQSGDGMKQPWQQPGGLAESFPRPISSRQWSIDFDAIEQRFTDVDIDESGELELDARVAESLKQTVLHLPDAMSNELLERIGLLFRKSFPGPKGEELASLFRNYWHYEQALERQARERTAAVAKEKPKGGADINMGRSDIAALQKEYLGDTTAAKLYGKQNSISAYLSARRRIQNDSSLSDSAKQDGLAALEREYREKNLR